MKYCSFQNMTIHEAGAVGEPRFEIATVLTHVCKIWPSADQDHFLLKLAERQTLRTQWFQRFVSVQELLYGPFVCLPVIPCGKGLISKHSPRAVKSLRGI